MLSHLVAQLIKTNGVNKGDLRMFTSNFVNSRSYIGSKKPQRSSEIVEAFKGRQGSGEREKTGKKFQEQRQEYNTSFERQERDSSLKEGKIPRKWSGNQESHVGIKSQRDTRNQWQNKSPDGSFNRTNNFKAPISRPFSTSPSQDKQDNRFNGAASSFVNPNEREDNLGSLRGQNRDRNSVEGWDNVQDNYSRQNQSHSREENSSKGRRSKDNFSKEGRNQTASFPSDIQEQSSKSYSRSESNQDSRRQKPKQYNGTVNPQSQNFRGRQNSPFKPRNQSLERTKNTSRENFNGQTRSNWNRDTFDRGMPYREEEPSHLKLIKDNWQGDVLHGVNPIISALKAERRSFYKLYIQEGGQTPPARKDILRKIQALAVQRGIDIEWLSKHDLNVLSDDASHQGLLLDCSSLEPNEMTSFHDPPPSELGSRPPLWIALDEVQDPHNFGAILRTAYFLGVNGVLTCTRNSSPLSPVVSKTSAGAMEHIIVWDAPKLQQTLASAADSGWHVVGAVRAPNSKSCSELELDRPTILVVGNEGSGLRTTVKASCSELVQIEGHGDNIEPEVDSLNVSVAVGILLHKLLGTSSMSEVEPSLDQAIPA